MSSEPQLECDVEKQAQEHGVRLVVSHLDEGAKAALDIMVFDTEHQCDALLRDLWLILNPPRVGECRRFSIPISVKGLMGWRLEV